jgi:AcrR family transcriptional regulator
VVAAALDLVEADGVGALSIRRVADTLGVRGPSLYHHFRNRAELVELVVDAAMEATLGEIDPAGLGRSWRNYLTRLAHAYRDVLRRHRGLASLMAQHRLPSGPSGLAIYDATLSVLLKAGFSPRDALAVYVGVCNHVLSSVQREGETGDLVWSMDELGRVAMAINEGTKRYPALTDVAGETLRLTHDDLFTHTLTALLTGYERLVPSPSR